jgi:CheY-like chemotaxis protein
MSITPIPLYWSKKGEVACADHAPIFGSERWHAEGWRAILTSDGNSTVYCCQHCEGSPRLARKKALPSAPLVLNVDDRPAMLYLRDRILREHGFIVANADSGEQALDVIRQLKPQLILLDIHLPDTDGRELCLRIKQDPEMTGIPVVLISATLITAASELDVIRVAEADGFIREPVEPASLASTLWKVLGRVA